MTSKYGDDVHPGDPWHPDWKPHAAKPAEDQWPLDVEEGDEDVEDVTDAAAPVDVEQTDEAGAPALGYAGEAPEDDVAFYDEVPVDESEDAGVEVLEPGSYRGAEETTLAAPAAGEAFEDTRVDEDLDVADLEVEVADEVIGTADLEVETVDLEVEVADEAIEDADLEVEVPDSEVETVDLGVEAADLEVDQTVVEGGGVAGGEAAVSVDATATEEEIPYLRSTGEEWWQTYATEEDSSTPAGEGVDQTWDAGEVESVEDVPETTDGVEPAPAGEAGAEEIPYLRTSGEDWWQSYATEEPGGDAGEDASAESSGEETSEEWIDEQQVADAWDEELSTGGPLIDPSTAETPAQGWEESTGTLWSSETPVDSAEAIGVTEEVSPTDESLLAEDEAFEVEDALPGELDDGTDEQVLDVLDFEEAPEADPGGLAGLLFQTPTWSDSTAIDEEDETWGETAAGDTASGDTAAGEAATGEATPGFDEPPAAWEQDEWSLDQADEEVPGMAEVATPEEAPAVLTDGESVAAEDAGPVITAEDEIVAGLTEDMEDLEFESFALHEFTGAEYQHAQTREHVGLAEAMAAPPEDTGDRLATAPSLPGLDSGVVDFDDVVDQTPGILDEDEAPVSTRPGLRGVARSDLAMRVVSAAAFGLAFLFTLWPGGWWLAAFLSAVALVGLTEFYSTARKQGYRPVTLFGLGGAVGALVGSKVAGPVAIPAAMGATMAATFAWYGAHEKLPHEPWKNGVVTVFGAAWVAGLLSFAVAMADSPNRFRLLFATLLIAAFMDIGSYFVGRSFGKRKLAPVVSPNKTVEGLVGGALTAFVVALIVGVAIDPFTIGRALLLAFAIIVIAPFGDLAESMVKRDLGVKDMGSIVAGHGGVLDRIDAYLFVLPAAYLAFRWMGIL